MTNKNIAAYLSAFAAIFLWSLNNIIASYFATSLTPWELAFGRWLVASFILVPMAWIELKSSIKVIWQKWWLVVAMALTGVVLNNTMIYYAGESISAVDIGLLNIVGPIFLIVLSAIFFKTQIGQAQILGFGVAICGVLTVVSGGNLAHLAHFDYKIGDVYILLNALCFAIYSLLQGLRPKEVSQTGMLGATALCGTLILLPAFIFFTPEQKMLSLTMLDIELFIYLGVFNSALSFLAWNVALKRLGNIKTGIIYYTLPIFTAIEAYFFLQEEIGLAQVWGGLLIIGGIVLAGRSKKTLQK